MKQILFVMKSHHLITRLFKMTLLGLFVDAYLISQFATWPLAAIFAWATDNLAHLLVPFGCLLHIIWKRKQLLSKSVCVKNLLFLCFDVLEEEIVKRCGYSIVGNADTNQTKTEPIEIEVLQPTEVHQPKKGSKKRKKVTA